MSFGYMQTNMLLRFVETRDLNAQHDDSISTIMLLGASTSV